MAMVGKILRLRITLADSKPPVWREVEVVSATTLAGLHDVLQVLMGWEDSHLWAFEAGARRFEPLNPDGMSFGEVRPEDPDEVALGEVLAQKGGKLAYNYDFGDDWRLEVALIGGAEPEPKTRYPRCLAGERAGPPEDCGGSPGFAELLAARKNPRTRGARELLKWAGEVWDPDAFDLKAVNEKLSALRAPRRRH